MLEAIVLKKRKWDANVKEVKEFIRFVRKNEKAQKIIKRRLKRLFYDLAAACILVYMMVTTFLLWLLWPSYF